MSSMKDPGASSETSSSDGRLANLFQKLPGSAYFKRLFRKPQNELTVLFVSKGHENVRKIHLLPNQLWFLKIGLAVVAALFILSGVFLVDYLLQLPEQSILREENAALRREINNVQFHLDTLQNSVERMTRFDQKLRALTEVDKEFSKMRGPKGQGGGEPEASAPLSFDAGDYKIDAASLKISDESSKLLDRREIFLFQKIYAWMRRLYGDSDLREQSLEELFEVLKGREIQLSATPSILPVRGWITSLFGYRIDPFNGNRTFHRGIDIAAKEGTPIVSPADGVVTYVGPYGSFGNTLMIFHGYGIATLFAHTDELYARIGQKVKRGDVVASTGNSGRSTGSHLHYEVIVHGVPVDPRKYILDRTL